MTLRPDYLFCLCRPAIILLLFSVASQASAAPNVVVSIPPIHSLVSAVMLDVAEPELIIPGGQSPHSYSLKPSAVRRITQADLLVWISPEFELSLKKAVTQQQNLSVMTLIDLPGLGILTARQSLAWQSNHNHIDQHEHSAIESATVGLPDMHLWLSAENAIMIVRAVEQRLSLLDPANGQIYSRNSLRVIDKIKNAKINIARSLQEIEDVPYLVFHDAYHYFEHEYGLSSVGTVTLNPERKPGIKTLRAIEQNIRLHDARCIFYEPQFQPRLLRRIAENVDIRMGELDPIGATMEAGPDLWFELMFSLRNNLLGCIKY